MRSERLEVRSGNAAFLGILIILADQVSKSLASPGIKNPGLPFGIDLPGFLDFYLVAGLLAIFVSLYVFYFRKLSWGFVLVTSGALSNLLDRIYFGYVRDLINIGIATMNVADVLIWLGIALLVVNNAKLKNQNDKLKS